MLSQVGNDRRTSRKSWQKLTETMYQRKGVWVGRSVGRETSKPYIVGDFLTYENDWRLTISSSGSKDQYRKIGSLQHNCWSDRTTWFKPQASWYCATPDGTHRWLSEDCCPTWNRSRRYYGVSCSHEKQGLGSLEGYLQCQMICSILLLFYFICESRVFLKARDT